MGSGGGMSDGLAFPIWGRGYKKRPCRMQARPGSQSLSKPFSPSSELLHGGILANQSSALFLQQLKS